MRMDLIATLYVEKPDLENIRGLNLAAAKLMTVHLTKLPL
jgi:hypothetical protein